MNIVSRIANSNPAKGHRNAVICLVLAIILGFTAFITVKGALPPSGYAKASATVESVSCSSITLTFTANNGQNISTSYAPDTNVSTRVNCPGSSVFSQGEAETVYYSPSDPTNNLKVGLNSNEDYATGAVEGLLAVVLLVLTVQFWSKYKKS